MLRIIEGGFGSGAHDMINKELCDCVVRGQRAYLIVPEQQTVIAEAELSELLPDSAPLYFEVTNFTRLANTVFRTLGGVGGEYCDNTKKKLIMWNTLSQLKDTLAMTGGREVSAGSVERALMAVNEAERVGIDSASLAELEEKLPKDEGRLISKTRDLYYVMTLYKKLLGEKFSDTSDDVGKMITLLTENPGVFADTKIYIEGFTSFTEPQYRLIAKLAEGCEVSVHFNIPKSHTDSFEYTELREARARLTAYLDRGGVEKKLIRLDGCDGNEYISECINQLWRTGGKIDNNCLQFNNEIEIIEAQDPYEECDFIAADIQRRVKLGAKYRDFAVIARHSDSYIGILDSSFEKMGVPTFFSKRRDASGYEATKLIYTAYSIITGGWQPEDVISYAKCTPSGISRDACDEFELYVRMWGISGNGFSSDEIWNMNPDGYTVRHSDDMAERLVRINETRRSIITPLINLQDSCRRSKTVLDYAKSLYDFLDETHLAESIEKRHDELISLGENSLAEEYSVLWDIICRSLDTLVACSADAKTTTDAFLAQLKIAFASIEVGKIPSYYDSVSVGSADMIRLFGKRHIYIIGLNRGEFPEATADNDYFSDREKLTLSSLGLDLCSSAAERGAREMYIFLRAMSYAKESLTLLYTKKTSALGDAAPSEIIEKIKNISCGKIQTKKLSEMPPFEHIYSPEGALESLGKFDTPDYLAVKDALCDFGYGNTFITAEGCNVNSSLSLSDESVRAVAAGTLALTQSRIDDYNSCPLLYFLRYNLNLNPDERAEFDARNIGSFIHAVLESFFGEVRRKKLSLNSIDADLVEKMVREGADGYLELLEGGAGIKKTHRDEVLLDRLCRAATPVVMSLCDEFKDSGFIPRYFELKIGGDRPELPEPARFVGADGKEVYVYGTIDRVDTCKLGDELYVRVVDYKTGKKDFSPSDIEKGKNLQMFLYLKSIVDTKNREFLTDLGVESGRKPVPAGVVYVKTEVGDIKVSSPDSAKVEKAISDAQKRKGMILAEPEVLNATGVKYSPVRIAKSGAIHGSDTNKAYTREGWDAITEKLSDAVCGVATGIRAGNISADTASDACTYCKFKPICRAKKH